MTDETPQIAYLAPSDDGWHAPYAGIAPCDGAIGYMHPDHARALVAAALRRWHEWHDSLLDAAEATHRDGGREMHRLIRSAPIALEDAEKALADLLRKARNEGRRQAAEICQAFAIAGGDADDCEQAILALIEKEPGQ